MPIFGPSGGTGGGVTDNDEITLNDELALDPLLETRMIKVELHHDVDEDHGPVVTSVEFTHLKTAGPKKDTLLSLPRHGVGNGGEEKLDINREEHIVHISGTYGRFVNSITIKTNQNREVSAGEGGGQGEYTYEAPEGFEIVGFHGRSGEFVDAMGVVMRKIP